MTARFNLNDSADKQRAYVAFLREIYGVKPLTAEEFQQAYDEAPEIRMSDERIAEIVAYATRKRTK